MTMKTETYKKRFLPTRVSLLGKLQDPVSIAVWNAAWFEFTQMYGRVIHAFARNGGLQDADADEVVSLVLVKIQRGLKKFEYDPKRGRFMNWVMRITRNEFNSYLRRLMRSRDRFVDVHSADDEGDPWDWFPDAKIGPDICGTDRDVLNTICEEALTRVRKKCRKDWVFHAFKLHFLEEVSIAEVVDILKITPGNISVSTNRVRKVVQDEGSEMWRHYEQGVP
jgi:RNA polymerase sigma factor (sigma-70 family)